MIEDILLERGSQWSYHDDSEGRNESDVKNHPCNLDKNKMKASPSQLSDNLICVSEG